MKIRALLFIFSLLFYFNGLAQSDLSSFLNKITPESVKAHVDTLASESMEGRYSGAPGQKLAAQYIANEFAKYGLLPYDKEAPDPFYQKFDLYSYSTGFSEIYYTKAFFWSPIYVGSKSISDSIYSPIVFTGYADDLKDLNVNNNSIFFLSESVASAIERVKEISDNYTINTFVIGLPMGKDVDRKLFRDTITDLKTFKDLYYYYNYFITRNSNSEDFNKLKSINKIIPNIKIESEKDIKILFVPEFVCGGIFQEDLKIIKKIAGTVKKPKNKNLQKIKSAYFSYIVDYNPTIDTLKTENVIGYIDSDLSDQKIIIGAHYDHIGINNKNEINYGADDNASGTAAVLSIAQLLSEAVKDGKKFSRDVVFITYSAEELGLHGSEYYVNNPLFPLDSTEVLFNLDMIGRDKDDDPNYSNTVFLLDWKGGGKYTKNVQKLNREFTQLNVDINPDPKDQNLWTYGSDHYSFTEKGVSSIAYFTALHKDYHTPGDTSDKLNYNKLNRIVKLVFLNIWDLTIQEK